MGLHIYHELVLALGFVRQVVWKSVRQHGEAAVCPLPLVFSSAPFPKSQDFLFLCQIVMS